MLPTKESPSPYSLREGRSLGLKFGVDYLGEECVEEPTVENLIVDE